MILGALDSNYLARTRQVHELIVKNWWYKIFLKDPSPHCQLFVDLSREWESLDTSPEAEVQMVHLPARVHKARVMAWSLCSMKALAFANDLNFSEETKEKLWRFALFQVGIYIPHFLMSSCGSDAAVNDLALHKRLQKFREDVKSWQRKP